MGNSKSLPDFLADGAVCSQAGECSPSVSSPGNELQMLRQDLDVTRRQYAEQLQICESLNRQLERRKKNDQDIVEKFTKSLQFVEENLAAAVVSELTGLFVPIVPSHSKLEIVFMNFYQNSNTTSHE